MPDTLTLTYVSVQPCNIFGSSDVSWLSHIGHGSVTRWVTKCYLLSALINIAVDWILIFCQFTPRHTASLISTSNCFTEEAQTFRLEARHHLRSRDQWKCPCPASSQEASARCASKNQSTRRRNSTGLSDPLLKWNQSQSSPSRRLEIKHRQHYNNKKRTKCA